MNKKLIFIFSILAVFLFATVFLGVFAVKRYSSRTLKNPKVQIAEPLHGVNQPKEDIIRVDPAAQEPSQEEIEVVPPDKKTEILVY